ncbi:WD40 repeat-like protein [Lentinus tigrinus ALCF2SS1-7]|uniref:WD40 repeat-like protein n=1 Tax=Lentinus tigrinus ALCF2SS1-7 TaxID=1328758 RepID=UPI001165F07A|nr:WD40 repeat-like protein [Lentinus tigrinus ALCF2SS1-7]
MCAKMDSATSFDSLQLGQVDEENVMPLAVSPPRQTAFSSSDLSLDSSIPPSNVEPALQPMATIVVEHSQSAISSHLKNPAFTSTAKGVPKFRSGRLRFELPRRQHVNSDGPMTSNAHQSTTFQALQSERRSVSPEYPDIHELLRDNVVEDAGPISGNQGPATPDPDAVELVLMRVDPHDKPRHLFVLPSPSGVLSVTMRGSFDLVEQEPLRRTALRTAGMSEEARQLIDDACLLRSSQGHVVALGRVGDAQQLSVVRILDKVVTDVGTFDRPTQPGKKGGISAICGLPQAGSFATGGYDHIVHRWSLEEHLATPARLPIRHTSTIQSLLHLRDSSDKLLSGSADCSVTVYDISAERVINSLKLSNSVYQVHAAPSPSCALLEVGHRELQFEVRDLRLVPTASVVRFGYPNVKVHGRYTRGAVRDHIFACGGSEKDGCVRLWDLRKPSEVLKSIQCFPGRKAIQIAFDGAQMIACSEDHQLALLAHNL